MFRYLLNWLVYYAILSRSRRDGDMKHEKEEGEGWAGALNMIHLLIKLGTSFFFKAIKCNNHFKMQIFFFLLKSINSYFSRRIITSTRHHFLFSIFPRD